MAFSEKLQLLKRELREHLPFTLIGVTFAFLFVGLVQFLILPKTSLNTGHLNEQLYHLFHYGHVLISAIATVSIFIRHENNWPKAIFTGYFATLIACGLSDAIIPFIGGRLLGIHVHFHICLLETPAHVLIANTLGIIIGIAAGLKSQKISYISHSSHVFVSSFASLFYLISFGIQEWLSLTIGFFLVTVLAVIIPCCSSDIVIPVSFLTGYHGHEHEDEHTHSH